MEQGVVPNPTIAEFKGYWTAKQGDLALAQVKGQQLKLRVKLVDTRELKTKVEAIDIERQNSCLEQWNQNTSLVVYYLDSIIS